MIYRFLDIETYCNLDLTIVGRKNYMEHPSFEINLIGWVDLLETELQDFSMKEIENEFEQIEDLKDWKQFLIDGFNNPNITLVAHNAAFEIAAFEKVLNIAIDLNRVLCTMVKCYQTGLPGALDKASKVLKLEYAKLPGKTLIKYFASPCRATKTNGGRIRNMPSDNPSKWDEYKFYNKYDVLATVELYKKVLLNFPQPDIEHKLYMLDRKINNKGLRIDTQLVHNAVDYVLENEKICNDRLVELTGLSNPNSTTQMTSWLKKYCPDQVITSIDKDRIKIIAEESKSTTVKEVIKLKQMLSKTSTKKYITLEKIIHGGRVYDTLAFTATGTGRWAGRGFQVHNLPKNKLKENMEQIRQAYKHKTRPITDDLSFELSQLLRTVIIPDEGKILLVCDYSAIEARIAAWVAQEEWVLEVFREDGKIYEAMAMKMFNLPDISKVTQEDRQDGKVAVLAGGYGGGYKAFQNFAPDWEDDKAQIMVDYYRDSNPKIVKMWKKIENAVKYTIKNRAKTKITIINEIGIIFKFKKGCLLIELPSGRNLTYVRAVIVAKTRNFNNTKKGTLYTQEVIQFEKLNSVTKQWDINNTYGGELFENIVQAIARDILANALLNLDSSKHDLLFHVHDEIITQVNITSKSEMFTELQLLKGGMCSLPEWAEGLPISAEGFITPYYMKEDN
jgi:DNA polymerase bacteriophage-type